MSNYSKATEKLELLAGKLGIDMRLSNDSNNYFVITTGQNHGHVIGYDTSIKAKLGEIEFMLDMLHHLSWIEKRKEIKI